MQTTIEIHGTLREDGTLELDEKPKLPPGRVKVTVAPEVDLTQTAIWQFFQRIWAERAAAGVPVLSPEEIEAYIATMRDEDDRWDRIEQAQASCQSPQEQPKPEA